VSAGEVVEVEVVDERTRHIRSLVGSGKTQAAGARWKAPMPGLVVRVMVEPGQTVAAGAGLVVLEAMKMENELKAPRGGVVEAVAARPGLAVGEGARAGDPPARVRPSGRPSGRPLTQPVVTMYFAKLRPNGMDGDRDRTAVRSARPFTAGRARP